LPPPGRSTISSSLGPRRPIRRRRPPAKRYAPRTPPRLTAGSPRSSGADLGIEVTRADLSAFLPAGAKAAFDQVLTAGQTAEQTIAQARTAAEEARQRADQESDQILSEAQSAAFEKGAQAHARTAEVESLAANAEPGARPAIIERTYRQRMGAILHSAGAVTALDARGGSRAILPGSGP
jgi:regulator of protease activity HflC (stomatin/prohibitin superfamily)